MSRKTKSKQTKYNLLEKYIDIIRIMGWWCKHMQHIRTNLIAYKSKKNLYLHNSVALRQQNLITCHSVMVANRIRGGFNKMKLKYENQNLYLNNMSVWSVVQKGKGGNSSKRPIYECSDGFHAYSKGVTSSTNKQKMKIMDELWSVQHSF